MEQDAQICDFFTMKCELCVGNVEFDKFLRVRQHYRKVHKMNGYLRCCGLKFEQRGKALEHIDYHKVTQKDPDAVTPSKREQEEAQIREFFAMKCEICTDDVKFETFSKVRQHYLSVHNVNGFLTCCGIKFEKRWRVLNHIRSHINPLRCDQCGKICKTKYSLQLHISNHVPLDSRAFKCTLCRSSFASAPVLKLHVKSKHTSKTGEKFPCDKCGKK